MNKRLSFFIALLLSLPMGALHADDLDTLRAEARVASAADDGARLAAIAARLLQRHPGHPTYLYFQARGAALQGNPEIALDVMRSLTARGADLLDPVTRDAAFDAMRALPAFAALENEVVALRAPVGRAERAWSFGPADAMPESVAVGADGRVHLGSVRLGGVLVREPDGTVRHWRAPESWSVQGLHFSPDGKTLWAATSAMNVTAGVDEESRGRTALVALDAVTGAVRARHVLPLTNEHVLGDFIFLDEDTLLATDSIGGGVYALDAATGEFSARVAPGTLRSPQGLARLGRFVYIADYGNGLYRFDPTDDALLPVADGPATPYGIDGLYAHDGVLLAIQNGIRPQQVARFTLSADGLRVTARETLLANHADFDEPTLGQIAGDTLLLVANSQWNHVTPEGDLPEEGLRPPVILSLKLPRITGR